MEALPEALLGVDAARSGPAYPVELSPVLAERQRDPTTTVLRRSIGEPPSAR